MQAAHLYHHEALDYYECMGCQECEETPRFAVLKGGRERVPVKGNAENRLLWLELIEKKHRRCTAFQDAEKAADQRELTRGLNAGSRDGLRCAVKILVFTSQPGDRSGTHAARRS